MVRYSRTELVVGAFVMFGILGLAYLSVSIGGLEWGVERIPVTARFASVGDLRDGAAVKVAGVRVGEVGEIRLDRSAAMVELNIDTSVELSEDTIASIRTEGLLGESYVLLRLGGSERVLGPGDQLSQTEPAIDLIDLLVKYALESGNEASEGGDEGGSLPDLFGD